MKEKLWNANYWKVMIANFTLFFAFYLLTPLLPLYLSEQFHATKDVIGIVLSGYTVMALLSRPFSGYGSLYPTAVHHCEDAAWCSLRKCDRGQFHDGHRCIAFVAPQ